MKFDVERVGGGEIHTLELTRRNLQALLDKLDDPRSAATLGKTGEHEGYIFVKAVEDEAHYSDRAPGEVYMPTTGEWR